MNVTNLLQARSRNAAVAMIMQNTGWSKSRAKKAVRELEENNMLIFPAHGGMMLQTFQEAY